jgi:hypothetical protein
VQKPAPALPARGRRVKRAPMFVGRLGRMALDITNCDTRSFIH